MSKVTAYVGHVAIPMVALVTAAIVLGSLVAIGPNRLAGEPGFGRRGDDAAYVRLRIRCPAKAASRVHCFINCCTDRGRGRLDPHRCALRLLV
jgi:hypothetical protein